MNSNLKDNFNQIVKSSSETEQFFALLDLPDEKFNAIYPNMKIKFDEAYKSDAIRRAMKQQLETMPMVDLEAEFDSVNNFINEIKKDNELSENKKDMLIDLLATTRDTLASLVKNPRDIIPVKVVKISEDAILPTYAHDTDGGADIYTIEDITIKPHTTQIIKTGLKMAIPAGYMINIVPRSGMSLKTSLRIANAPAVIDSDFRGEVGVIAENTSNLSISINKGDRIAQMIIMPVPMIKWEEVTELDNTTRGENGYGSTGQS